MEKDRPNTSFRHRQAFEFICPPDRAPEARFLLEQIEGLRLVPPNPNAQIVTRIHVTAGAIHGFRIQGVVNNVNLFDDVLTTLSQSEISGYSRAEQIIKVQVPRSEEEHLKQKSHETYVDQYNGKLMISHKWNKNISDDEEDFEERTVFVFPSENVSFWLEKLKSENLFQLKRLKQEIELRVEEGIGDENQMRELLDMIEKIVK